MITCTTPDSRTLCTHQTVYDAAVFHGIIKPPAQVAFTVPSSAPAAAPVRPATDKQVSYVTRLGGDAAAARTMSLGACSTYIDRLKKGTAPTVEPEPTKEVQSVLQPAWIEMIKDGYYATRVDASSPWHFFRVSRPTKHRFAGCVKIQLQHGSYYHGRWSEAIVLWPSSRLSVYRGDLQDNILVLISDQDEALQSYARELKRCCRCNAELTDSVSCKYGIGPECVKYWPWVVETIDLKLANEQS